MEFLAIILLIACALYLKRLGAENAKQKKSDTYQKTYKETQAWLQQLNSRSTQGTKPVVQSESKPELKPESKPEFKPEPKPESKRAVQRKGQGGHPCWTDGKGRYYLYEKDGLCGNAFGANSEGTNVDCMKYREVTLKATKVDGVAYSRKELISADGLVCIEKSVYLRRTTDELDYYLPVCNDDHFYFELVKSFNELSGANLENCSPVIYEDADDLCNTNYTITFFVDGGECEVFSHGIQKQSVISCRGKGVARHEDRYNELVVRVFEDAVARTRKKREMFYGKCGRDEERVVSESRPNDDLILSEPTRLAEEKKDKSGGELGQCGENLHWEIDKLTPECKGKVVRQGYCGNRHEHEGGKNLQWELYDNNVLRIWGSGNMFSSPRREEDYGSFGESVDYYSSPWEAGAWTDSPIEEVRIEDGVTSIGDYAFGRNGSVSDGWAVSGNHFPNLRAVYIPASVTRIGSDAFVECAKLVIYAPWGSYAEEFARKNGIPFVIVRDSTKSKDKGNRKSGACGENLCWALDEEGTLIISGNGPMKDYQLTIVDTVSEEDLWFELEYGDWCASVGDTQTHYVSPWHSAGEIRKVIVKEGVTSIGNNAFAPCGAYYGSAMRSNSHWHLTDVILPSSLEVVEIRAFEDCQKLASIKISVGLKRIEWWAFRHCQSLTRVTLPDGTQEIGASAFEGCDNLTEISIPASVTVIGKNAFARCPKLVIHAPKGSYAEEYAKEKRIPFVEI